MRALSLVAVLAGVQCVAACSLAESLTASDLQEVMRNAVLSHAEFRRIAPVVVQSSIAFADGKSVRYRVEGDGDRTDPWESAQVSPAIRSELRDFIAARHAEAIFANEHRVNFVLWGTGLAVSGVSVGVIVAPIEELGCSEVVTSVKLDRRGLQCERLDDSIYFYLYR